MSLSVVSRWVTTKIS
jgi:hypothetical protein